MNFLKDKRNIMLIFIVVMVVLILAYLKCCTCLLGHRFQKATCLQPQVCSLCNYKVGETIEHSFVKHNETSATCTDTGTATYVCSECQFEKTEIIPKTDHKFLEKDVVNSSCVKDGYTIYECTECQIQKSENSVALNHSITNGICERCKMDFKAKKNEFLSEIKQIESWIKGATEYTYIQSDLNSISSEELYRWDKLLNEIYQYLKTVMTEQEFEVLQADEKKWVTKKEKDVKKYSEEWGMGSAATMEINGYECGIVKDRCYYLLSKLDAFIK